MKSLIAGLLASAVVTVPQPLMANSPYLWKYRPLLVFADREANPSLAEQRRIIAASRVGLVERQVPVIWVVGDSVSTDGGPGPGRTAAKLRAQYASGLTDFRAVLLGKDGGVKLASSSPIRVETLYSTIDAMPMRRDEMRRR